MICSLGVNKCQKCHWRASSCLFMPNGCNVLALFIKWASRAFQTESRLLRMSSIGMRWTSLIEWSAWLKCSDTGVGAKEARKITDTISCKSKNLIYLIECKKCHHQYIGDTKRQLSGRFGEHRRSILNH